MKEEQNASSSANYDVELFHVREAHEALVLGEAGDLPVTKKVSNDHSEALLISLLSQQKALAPILFNQRPQLTSPKPSPAQP